MLDGSDLKSVRKNAGISQTDMAKKLDCDRRTIINYEQGVCEPKASQLFRWLDACKIDLKPLAAQLRNIKESLLLLFTLGVLSPNEVSFLYVGILTVCALHGIVRSKKGTTHAVLIIISLYTLEYILIDYYYELLLWCFNSKLVIAVLYYSFQISFSVSAYYIFSSRAKRWLPPLKEKTKPTAYFFEKTLSYIYVYLTIITTLHLIEFYIDEKYNYTFLSVFYTHYENLIYIGMSLVVCTLAAMVASNEKELRRLKLQL